MNNNQNRNPLMPSEYPNKIINSLAQNLSNIHDDMEQGRYNTIHPRGHHNIHKRNAQVYNQHGNQITPSENFPQITYEKTRENEMNRRKAIKLLLNNYQNP